MKAVLEAIEYHLPADVVSNEDLAREYPDWSVEKIESKTGIAERRIAKPSECSSDLAVAAARKLFDAGACAPGEIDYLLLCTQSPDFFLPTTACLVQDQLGLPCHSGALDFNLGCSGFVYGLGLAKGLIETGQAHNVLLITAETYSKFIRPSDRSVRTIFGDAAAATLIRARDTSDGGEWIGPFVFGTDGKGAENLIVREGAIRNPATIPGTLHMNGAEVFDFTLRAVPPAVHELLVRSGKTLEDIDLFVFHQANQYMLDHLRKKLKIDSERFLVDMHDCGNTVSSTIPIALHRASRKGRISSGSLLMLVGFGVGYSWSATLVRWPDTVRSHTA